MINYDLMRYFYDNIKPKIIVKKKFLQFRFYFKEIYKWVLCKDDGFGATASKEDDWGATNYNKTVGWEAEDSKTSTADWGASTTEGDWGAWFHEITVFSLNW